MTGYTAIVSGGLLTKAVKSLKAVSKIGGGLVTFHCNGEIEISAQSSEEDKSSTQVEILNSTGGDVEFTLPVQYVLDALTHILPKVKAQKGKRAELQTVTIHVSPGEAWKVPPPVWFTNGDLKAAIMPKWDRVIPEETPKPTKSELMSAYNRKRAELRRSGQAWKVWELNQAFGNLQRKNWKEVTPGHNASYALMAFIVETRATHLVPQANMINVTP